MRSLAALGVAAVAYQAAAQSASFDGMTWGIVLVGQVWPIHWTVGDGTPVSLFLGNTTWNEAIAPNVPAAQGEYNWTVSVPDGFVPGNYALALMQSAGTDYSPLFDVEFGAAVSGTGSSSTTATAMTTPPPTATTNGTLISASAEPTVTVTYWDVECGCTKTSAVAATASATGTGLSGTQYTWYDETCGCTKTAVAPATTMAASNYTVSAGTNIPPPPPTTLATSASTTAYTGEGSKVLNSGLAVVGLIVAAVLA